MGSSARLSQLLFLTALTFVSVSVSSCEEYIEPPFELEEAKLVITSNFSPGEKVTVRLTASQPVVGAARNIDVANASVGIYEGPVLIETLPYSAGEDDAPGVYSSHDFEPEIGVRYTLKASAPGFVPVTATSAIPTSADINRVVISDLQVSRTEEGVEVYNFDLLVDYNDPDFADNFYDLRLKQQVVPFYVVAETSDTVRLDPQFKAVEALADFTEENSSRGQSSYLVADKPDGGIRIALISKINPKTEIPGDLVIELRTVSRDYYNFQSAIQQEQRVFNTFFDRAVSSNFSNVGGGYGVFAGYSRVTRYHPLVY